MTEINHVMQDPADVLLCISTASDMSGARLMARQLVASGVVACVNLVPGVSSVYRWQGVLEESAEVLMLMKTHEPMLDRLKAELRAIHPYEVPELVVLRVNDGLPSYLQWVIQNSQGHK